MRFVIPTLQIKTGLTFCMSITEGRVTHVTKTNITTAGGVHEEVAVLGMERGRGDNFSEFFQSGWLDINNV